MKDEPPAVYSIQGNRASLQLDFEKALSVSERQGWGQVQFVFKLKDGETWDFSLYIGPPGTYLAVPHPEVSKRTDGLSSVIPREDPGARWWLVRATTGLNHLRDDDNISAFLRSQVIPLCREIRPVMGFGDVLDWGLIYRPSVQDLERSIPAQVSWFNWYGSEVIERIGRREWFEQSRKLSRWRVETFEDGSGLIVVTALPQLDEREWVRSTLGLDWRAQE